MQLESSLLLSLSMIAPALAADPIPVYVLAGQSNMEGKARIEVMERQLLEEATAARYAHLRDGDEWLGSPRTMLGVGEAFGEAVLELEALAKKIREEDAADAAPDL